MTTADSWSVPAPGEDERIRDVQRLGLLDTAPEERFEQPTRIARQVLGVPMASVSLMDRDRQWFKSIQGLELVQVPRENTVCRTTIARAYRHRNDPALILPDAAADPAFRTIPGIGGEGGIRFYAGYPLFGPTGHPVGTFCIYDTVARQLEPEQVEAFAEIADWVQREVERADELERAAALQNQLLPSPLAGVTGVEIATACLPAFVVGGDFYDHYRLRQGVVLTVADVMGKGLGAALVSSAVRSSLRGAARVLEHFGDSACSVLDTGSALTLAAENLADDCDRTGVFVTAFVAAVDPVTGEVDFVDAGHGLALIRRADGRTDFLDGGDLPIGVLPETVWTSHCTQLRPGEMLVICSDGLLDLLDEHSDRVELGRFVADYRSPEALIAAVRALADGRPPLDDVTVLAVYRQTL
ncbi:Phosphoserine phosphatase RsbU [Rhodococcus sp. B50]|nr:Phosphoserine phosphatase RsbU [Rhodococcus sp. B50]